MSNKDLANQLAALRVRAKQAASAEPAVKQEPKPVAAVEPKEQTPDNPKAAAAPQLKVLSNRKAAATKKGRGEAKPKASAPSGRLERTTITLKVSDTEALSDLQMFLMKRVRKASSTSTLIRLALSYTKQALSKDAETLAHAYQQILEGDGRRKVVTI